MSDHTGLTTAITELADQWRREATDMSLAAGDSPRPADYSEGHWVGYQLALRQCVDQLRQTITNHTGGGLNMSIYATTIDFDATDHHHDNCAQWIRCHCTDTGRHHLTSTLHTVDRHWVRNPTRNCTCQAGPIHYQGSHILPSDTDPRDGQFDLAEIPSHITRGTRGTGIEDGPPWPWLRVTVNTETVVLDHAQVRDLVAYLNRWTNRTQEETS